MDNPVFASLLENLKLIEIIFDETPAAFKTDTKNTGESKEISLSNFLRSYFPTNYQVKKGLIYSLGKTSREIDCVLLHPSHPNLVTPKREIILAEGVHAAIEVKPDIKNKKEFQRALYQVASVKAIDRKISYISRSTNLAEKNLEIKERSVIPTFIFSKFTDNPETLFDKLFDIVNSENNELTPDVLPDFIVSLEHGIFEFRLKAKYCSRFNELNKYFSKVPDSVIIHYEVRNEHLLAMFLLMLYGGITPPQPPLFREVLFGYLNSITAGQKFHPYEIIYEEEKLCYSKMKR
jgi:hypothetical protein